MKDTETRTLTSWKEIAQHLDVTVRTAQVWEKQRGLPVRRMPGRRSRVYLRLDEYEDWLLGQDSGHELASAPFSLRWGWIVALLAALIVTQLPLFSAPHPVPSSEIPADYLVVGPLLLR